MTRRHAPETTSQTRMEPSQDPVKHTSRSSGCQACARTLSVCPRSTTGFSAHTNAPPRASRTVHARAVASSETDSRRPGTSGENVAPYTLALCPPSAAVSRVVVAAIEPGAAPRSGTNPRSATCRPTQPPCVAVASTRGSSGSNATPTTGVWCSRVTNTAPE